MPRDVVLPLPSPQAGNGQSWINPQPGPLQTQATTALRVPANPKTMFLGDSLTAGISGIDTVFYSSNGFLTDGYREYICRAFPTIVPYGGVTDTNSAYLVANGKTQCEGHGGFTGPALASGLPGWLTATGVTIDLILLHCGTNGGANTGGQGPTAASVLTMYNSFMSHNPSGVMIVGCNPGYPCSTTYPGDASPYASVYLGLQACFAAILANVTGGSMPRSIPADCGSTVVDGNLISDMLHPTGAGYAKMAAGWILALQSLHLEAA